MLTHPENPSAMNSASSQATNKSSKLSKFSLRTKATLLAIALGATPLVLVGTGAYLVTQGTLKQEIEVSQKAQASEAIDKINRFVFERYGDVQAIANLPVLRNSQIGAIVSRQDKQQVLDQYARTYGVYDSIAVFELNGNVIVQSSGDFLGNHADRDYFQEVLKTDKPVISQPSLSKTSGKLSVHFAAPVKDSVTNKTIAVVRTRMPVEYLEALLKNYEGQSVDYHLYDSTGKIFIAGNKEQLGHQAADDFKGLTPLKAGEPSQFVKAVDNGAPAMIGNGVMQNLNGMPNPGWGVALAQSESLAFKEVNALRNLLLFGGLGAGAIVAILAAYLANRATKPLVKAAAAVAELGQGNLNTRLAVESQDELGTLSGNINQMAGQLQSFISVQERAAVRSGAFAEAIAQVQQANNEADILAMAVKEARTALNADRVVVYRFKEDWSGYIAAESVLPGFPKAMDDRIEDACIPQSLLDAYRKNRVVPTNDVFNANFHPEHLDLMHRLAIKSNLVTPILKQGQLMGLLVAHHCAAPHTWEQNEIENMSQFAGRVGIAIDQAETTNQQRRQSQSAQALSQVVSVMRQSLKREDILNTAVQGLRTAVACDRVVAYFFDSSYRTGKIQAESVQGKFTALMGKELEDGCTTEIENRYKGGQARAINDIRNVEISECYRNMLSGFQIAASVVAPIFQSDKFVGLLCAHQCAGPRNWSKEEVDLIGRLSAQVGFALDQADLLSYTEQSRQNAQLINSLITEVRQADDISEMMQIATKGARVALGAERVVAYMFSDGVYNKGTIVAESLVKGVRALTGQEFEDGCSSDMLERYKPGSVKSTDDIQTAEISSCYRQMLEDCQIRASIIAPITQDQNLIGLFCIHQCTKARHWSNEDIDLTRQIATQLGYALDQAYLLEYTEKARIDAREEADERADEQKAAKEFLQKRALELLMEVDPVSKGDLTIRATVTPDEVGTIADSYNAIIRALRQIVGDVQSASSSVATTATNNEAAVSALSIESKRQASSIGGVLLDIDSMMESIQGVARRAQQAEQGVQIAARTLEAGDQAMNRTVAGISTIRETVSETSKKVKRLGEASQKISKVVSLISDFAAQTNLLALNAAIEASRAGEEGRGFAVVAEEVRSLAQQSAAATAEIEQLVEEIQLQTSEVASAMEAGTEQVVEGTKLVEETRLQLGQINNVSLQINDLVREISLAAAAQTETSSTVTQTMRQVAANVTTTAEQSESVADSFGELLKVAQTLQVSVAQFKVK
jgi:methyl-accepting chemotaxis protein